MYHEVSEKLDELQELLFKLGQRRLRGGLLPPPVGEALHRVRNLKRLVNRIVAAESRPPGSIADTFDKLHDVSLDCETFYRDENRVAEVVGKDLGLGPKRKRPLAVERIRNRLIEHPEYEHTGCLALGAPGGPQFLQPLPEQRAKAAAKELRDAGLWVNALEFANTLITRLRTALQADPTHGAHAQRRKSLR